jgi:hypothetical protein
VLIHDDESGSLATACTIEMAREDPAHDRIGYVDLACPAVGNLLPLAPVGDPRHSVRLIRTPQRVPRCRVRLDYDSALLAAVDALQLGDLAYASPPYRRADRSVGALLVSGGRALADRCGLEANSLGVELFRRRAWPVFALGVGTASRDGLTADVLHRLAVSTGGRFHAAATAGDVPEFCAGVLTGLRAWARG